MKSFNGTLFLWHCKVSHVTRFSAPWHVYSSERVCAAREASQASCKQTSHWCQQAEGPPSAHSRHVAAVVIVRCPWLRHVMHDDDVLPAPPARCDFVFVGEH